MAVLYASISGLNLMQAATGSQCREIKRGVHHYRYICKGLIVHEVSPARRALQ